MLEDFGTIIPPILAVALVPGVNVIFIVLALFFTSPQVLSIIAVGALGALLVFVGLEMGRHSLKTDSMVITVIIGILALVTSMTLAFIAGMVLAYLITVPGKKRVQTLGNCK